MSREVLRCLLKPSSYHGHRALSRTFTTTHRSLDESKSNSLSPPTTPSSLSSEPESTPKPRPTPLSTSKLSEGISKARNDGMNLFSSILSDLKIPTTRSAALPIQVAPTHNPDDTGSSRPFVSPNVYSHEPFHLHCYSHKHNTHICLTRPNRDAIISVSTGNIGFKKAQRGSYDAAFQLTAYVMKLAQEKGLFHEGSKDYITSLEIILRNYGGGREGFLAALKGAEGSRLRPRIVRVSEVTRVKIGGTRGMNPRRLG